MALGDAGFMPYAPAFPVLTIIRRVRDRGLPETLSTDTLRQLGVAEGNADRVLRALRFLALIDDEDHRTGSFDRLGRTREAEYERYLAEIVHRAYAAIFSAVDPAKEGAIAIHDAFRPYQPTGQRQRMVSLFLSLCRESGIVAGGPVRGQFRARRATGAQRATATRGSSGQLAGAPDRGLGEVPIGLHRDRVDNSLLLALIDRLPLDGTWTKTQRDKWINAVAAAVDLAVDVTDSTS